MFEFSAESDQISVFNPYRNCRGEMKQTTLRKIEKASTWCFRLTFVAMTIGFIRLWIIDMEDTNDAWKIAGYMWPFIATFVFMMSGFALMIASSLAGGISNISLLRNGVKARAQIIELKKTGLMINEDPVVHFKLIVYPDDDPAFTAEAQNIVSIIDIPQYQKGSYVRVRFNPVNRETAIEGVE